jgi:hypothetical protein
VAAVWTASISTSKRRIVSSKVRRVIAIGMVVLVVIVSAATFYLRENRALHAATIVSPAPDMSHPLR